MLIPIFLYGAYALLALLLTLWLGFTLAYADRLLEVEGLSPMLRFVGLTLTPVAGFACIVSLLRDHRLPSTFPSYIGDMPCP